MIVNSFTISTPPSANSVNFNAPGKGRVKCKQYTAWRTREAWSIKAQGFTPHTGSVIVLIGVRRNSHLASADVDNRIKPTLDLLTLAGVISDDRHVNFVGACWYPPGPSEAVVTTYDAAPGEFVFRIETPRQVERASFAPDRIYAEAAE